MEKIARRPTLKKARYHSKEFHNDQIHWKPSRQEHSNCKKEDHERCKVNKVWIKSGHLAFFLDDRVNDEAGKHECK
ncbi:MAG: hypothetical protein AB197_01005 [Parcubacteria bacterium C7867-002]|nr:MAG: hypothetical protein AB197_01005 [Parcubacteria bacterium C7867-002]